jgi:hypothetical protein
MRRDALFTLVGIAGEDDLDAPDLCDGSPSFLPSAVDRSFKPTGNQSRVLLPTLANGHARGSGKGEIPVTLGPDQSVVLRDKLLSDLGNITSADLAATWAREALSAKNRLTATDARLGGGCLLRRLSDLPSSDASAPSVATDRILRGEYFADLPVPAQTKFETILARVHYAAWRRATFARSSAAFFLDKPHGTWTKIGIAIAGLVLGWVCYSIASNILTYMHTAPEQRR